MSVQAASAQRAKYGLLVPDQESQSIEIGGTAGCAQLILDGMQGADQLAHTTGVVIAHGSLADRKIQRPTV
jgi:hypothetical protein